jgi:hypothetical protein
MSNDFLIHEYLDSSLEGSAEQELFSALASDPMLRQEFGRQLKLKNIIEEESRRVTPPAALSSAIFGELGYAIPAGMATSASAVPFFHKIFPILGTMAALLLVGILSVNYGDNIAAVDSGYIDGISGRSLLFVAEGESASGNINSNISGDELAGGNNADKAVIALMQDSLELLRDQIRVENEYKSSVNVQNNQYTKQNTDITQLKAELNWLKTQNRQLLTAAGSGRSGSSSSGLGDSDSDYKSEVNPNTNTLNNDSMLFQFDLSIDEVLGSDDQVSNGDSFINNLASSVKTRLSEIMQSDEYQNSIMNMDKEPPVDTYTDNAVYSENNIYTDPAFGDVYVMLSYVQTVSNPDVSIDGTDVPLSVDAGMQLNGYFSVIADLGMESYGQSFNFQQNGREVIRTQNPTVYYYTAGIRANSGYIFNSLMPYVKLTAGGSSFGPMLRGGVGTYFRTNELLSVSVGYEGSMLWYTAEGDGYNTMNNGFSIGIVYHFD